MNPIILITITACILGSCTLGDGSLSTISTSQIPQASTAQPHLEDTTEVLVQSYQEELLAHDLYTLIVDTYPALSEVKNIIESEDSHREQIGKLLDNRNIARPTGYGIYDATATTLKTLINQSLTGAIEAGVMIETGDIAHLLAEYKKVSDNDIHRVFENIGGGSYNHLRAFLRLAQEYNYTVTTDYSMYLSQDDLSLTGSLKSKMTELLQKNNLPTTGVNENPGKGKNHDRMSH